MRIMTSNVWGDYFGNEVQVREDKLFKVYNKYAPDVIGFQEVTQNWYKSTLLKNMSDDYMLIGTELYENCNYVPMAVKKEFNLMAKGFEYLENTPDKSKAITWAVIEGKEGRVAVCNTHFWWMSGKESEEIKRQLKKSIGQIAYWTDEEHDNKRTENAEQLSTVMKYLNDRYSCPVFSFGDMNGTIASALFRVYTKNRIDRLFDLAKEKDIVSSHHGDPVRGNDGRYHGKTTSNDYTFSIDHIVGIGDNFKVKKYCVVTDTDALDANDHSPIYADIELQN